MFAVIFEVQPKKERWNDYLDLAKYLKPKLEAIDGFIDNERFEGKRTKGRVLSLSTWRDEKAVVRWRTQGQHHSVQEKGRFEIFEDYRLRVGEVTDDTDPPRGLSVVEQRFDETANPQAKAVSISELTPSQGDKPKIAAEHLPAQLGLGKNPAGLINHEVFESIYNPGKLLLLVTWRDAEAAGRWAPVAVADLGKLRHRRVRVIRATAMRRRSSTQRSSARTAWPQNETRFAALRTLIGGREVIGRDWSWPCGANALNGVFDHVEMLSLAACRIAVASLSRPITQPWWCAPRHGHRCSAGEIRCRLDRRGKPETSRRSP